MTGVIPAAVRLAPTFDAAQLAADLATVSRHTWQRQRVSGYHADQGERTELDWRVLPLRSVGGDGARTDPGGPGPADFAPTPWLGLLPYLAEVLDTLPGPLNAARLMALGPGTASHTHSDPKYAAGRGFLRLHLPIVTNPDAVLSLDGVDHRWQVGELWCGQFARPHTVRNDGTTTRIHLVIDVLISAGLTALLPAPLQDLFTEEALVTRPNHGATAPADLMAEVPEAFTDFSRDDVLTVAGPASPARITVGGPTGRLTTTGGDRFALVHLGSGEFRFAGWSEQRTLHLRPGEVALRTRSGGGAGELSIPYRKVLS